MTYLPSLIKKIDEFYKMAAPPEAWSMPDDPEESPESEEKEQVVPHFDDLMNISHQVEDPGLAQQLRVLAELYRYAISIGGGYSTIARAITNLKNMYSDGADSNIEFILNGMIQELSKQAGGTAALSGRDNPNFVQRLAQLKQDIEEREREAHSGALDAYNEEINAPGATQETEGELAESGLTPEEIEIVNPAALGFGDKDNPQANKGWHTVGSGKPYKNWKEYYEAERASYEADLAIETNPDIKKTLDELINILPKLSQLTEATLKLTNELKVAPSEQGEIKKAKMLDALREFKNKRQLLKSRIRSSQLNKDKQLLTEELANTRDPKQQQLISQKIALNELTQSNDVYKTDERNLRLALISSMSGGNFPGAQTYQNFLTKIEEASKKRKSKDEYDRIQSIDRAIQHGKPVSKELGEKLKEISDLAKAGKIDKPTYDRMRWELLAKERGSIADVIPERDKGKGRGGGIAGAKINQFDYELATFTGLVQKFSDKVNTASNTARQGVTQEIGPGGKSHNALKPFVDALSKAIQKNNTKAKYEAIRDLKSAIVDWSSREPALRVLEKNVRLLPYFNKYKEELKKISAWRTDEGWQLNEAQKTYIASIIKDAKRLGKIYGRFYTKPGQPELFYDQAIKQLTIVLQRLENETGVTGAPDAE